MYDKKHLELILEEFSPLNVHALEKEDYELYGAIIRIEDMLKDYISKTEDTSSAYNVIMEALIKTSAKVYHRVGSPKDGYLLMSY